MSDHIGARRQDAVAAALGNATLLGVGYLLVGRPRLAAGTTAITAVLLGVLGASGWVAVLVLLVLWWAVLVVHGFVIAGGRDSARIPRHRVIAVIVAVIVVAVFAALTIRAGSVTSTVEEARARGDCPAATAAQGGLWFGPRVVAAPAATRGDETVQVCEELASARRELDRAAGGDLAALGVAQSRWDKVLRVHAGHERMVEVMLREFIAASTRSPSCRTADVARWFDPARLLHPATRPAVAAATAFLPTAVVSCGDEFRSRADWGGATARYVQALALRPEAAVVQRAQLGLAAAAAGQAESDTRARLAAYCTSPFAYPAAPAPGPSGRVFVDEATYGRFAYALPLTQEQRATEAASASVVVCIGGTERGGADETCTYVGSGGRNQVSFFRTAIPVRAYETRTGRVLLDRRVEVGDAVCPPSITYTSYGPFGGPPDQDIPVSEADLGSALRDVVSPVLRG